MVRTPLRVLFATWTLVALIVTSVGPAVNLAWAEASGQRGAHACCPETVGEGAPADHLPDAPPPCCAVGNANSQAPASAPTPGRSGAPNEAAVLAPAWNQTLAPKVEVEPHSSGTLGPIPLVIRTSVLLI